MLDDNDSDSNGTLEPNVSSGETSEGGICKVGTLCDSILFPRNIPFEESNADWVLIPAIPKDRVFAAEEAVGDVR